MDRQHPQELYFSWSALSDVLSPEKEDVLWGDLAGKPAPEDIYFSWNDIMTQKSHKYLHYSPLSRDSDGSQCDETESLRSSAPSASESNNTFSSGCTIKDCGPKSTHSDCDSNDGPNTDHSHSVRTYSTIDLDTSWGHICKPSASLTTNYLSHEWHEEEILTVQKDIKLIGIRDSKGPRWDNALWRAWGKSRSSSRIVATDHVHG